MHASRRALRLLFFLSVFAQAQEPTAPPLKDHTFHGPAYFENAKDSTDFMQFRNGLAADASLPTDTTTQYHMLWRENQHGGMSLLSRGDSSLIKAPVHGAFSVYSETSIPFRTADGRRVLVLTHEVPCGLICRSTWYYVEE
ncbi:MAG: hypothetical protein IPO87_07910 [Flavobacteriales bacterium]|nr:hypothetical protein [Flavobacteriales bacterium]